jgi:hypothetical protein
VTNPTMTIPEALADPLCRQLGQGAGVAFVGTVSSGDDLVASAIFPQRVDDLDFADPFHEALSDAGRGRLIAWAHDLGYGLAEFHRHGAFAAACFSWIDLAELPGWAAHIGWRLPGRPYVAIVVAGESLDALLWPTGDATPIGMSAINFGRVPIRPTGLSLQRIGGS